MASGGLGSLTVDLLLETLNWVSGLNKAEQETAKFKESVGRKFDEMNAQVSGALKGMAAGLAGAFTVGSIVSFLDQTQQAADRLDELAQKSGTTVTFLTQMGEAGRLSGVGVESIGAALTKLNLSMVEASGNAGSKQARVFESLGVAIKNADGSMRSSEAVAKDFNAALGKLEDGATKTAIAVAIYGKAGAEQIAVVNSLANATWQQKDAWAALGAEMEKLSKSAGAYEEQQQLSQTRTKEMGALLAQEFLPYLTKLMTQWNNLSASGKGLGGVMTFLANTIKGVIIIIDAAITGAIALTEIVLGAWRAFQKFKDGDWSGAADEWRKSQISLGDTLGGFKERLDALVNPMAEETRATKAQTAATDAQRKAVEDLAKAKKFNPIIDSDKFKPLAVVDTGWYTERGLGIDENAIRSITQKATEIRLKEEERLEKEHAEWLKDNYGQLFKDIESLGQNAFENLFDSAGGGWKKMLAGMWADFKKLLMNLIYKQIAQPLFLNLVAMVGGQSGIGQLAQNALTQNGVGGGGIGDMGSWVSMGQKAYDYFWGSGTATAAGTSSGAGVGGMVIDSSGAIVPASSTGASFSALEGAGYGAAGGLFGYAASSLYGAGDRGVANATSYGAAGASAGAYIGTAVFPVIGTVVGAAIGAVLGTIIGISTDPDPDAMRKGTFGSASATTEPQAYAYTSKLGTFGISDTEWFSDSDMESVLKPFMEGMKKLDDAIAATLTDDQLEALKTRLEDLNKQYEFGMEHGGIDGLGEILRDRLKAVVQTVAPEFEKFFDAFTGGIEDLARITAGYLSLRSMTKDFDPTKIVDAVYAENEAKKSQFGLYEKQRSALEEQVIAFDGSAQATEDMVVSLGAFQQATIAMVIAIDAAAAAIHSMFMETADAIRKSIMAPMERYEFLQDRSANTFDLLKQETDPQKIQELAASINRDINEAFALLSPEEQKARADEFLTRLDAIDKYVASQMGALRTDTIGDATTINQSIADKLDAIFLKGDATADKNLEAADKNLEAANTPVVVVVQTNDGGIVTAAG